MLNNTKNLPTPFRALVKGLALACVLYTPVASIAAENTVSGYTSKAALFVNVTGRVVDINGQPIAGATVLVKGSKAGVRTDQNGTFRINVPAENPYIVVSFVGYKVLEVNVAGRQDITVALEESNAAIDEVVVTGYGTQKRSEIVGSVATRRA